MTELLPRPVVKHGLLCLLIASFTSSAIGEELAVIDRLRTDLEYLASDRLEGRDVGTPGGAEAANYIRDRFRTLGLRSGVEDGSYFQPFEVRTGTKVDETTFLEVTAPDGTATKLEIGKDYQALVFGGDGAFDAPIVFAGYGITDEEIGYDDYKDLDVEGKVVLVLRREPQFDDPQSKFNGTEMTNHAAISKKVEVAWEKKAAAVLIVSPPAMTAGEGDALVGPTYLPGSQSVGVPLAQISQEFADRLLAGSPLGSLAEIERKIDEKLEPCSRELDGWKIKGEFAFVSTRVETPNIIGIIDGEGPLANETIVIGAHYDHIGMGGPGSRSPKVHAIHNGADDNASGTTMLLELARRFTSSPEKPKRRLVFIAFSGEERGLLGSSYYVRRQPVVPLEETNIMINFDMVGRLRKERLILYGTKTADGLEPIITKLDEKYDDLSVTQVALGVPASDHISFYRKNVPALHLFTGTHPEYHMPTDDPETINFDGMRVLADFSEDLIKAFVDLPERPQFAKVEESDPHAGLQLPTGTNVPYLGTSPDYGDEVKGVLLNGVREGSPADLGGLRSGDVIVAFDGKPVENVRQYTTLLYGHQPGDVVEIGVLRGDGDKQEKLTLSVTLGKRGDNSSS